MDKELIKELSRFESYFNTAIKSDYIRCLSAKDKEFLIQVYTQLGKKIGNKNCSGCVLAMVKYIGTEYYKQLNTENNGRKKKRSKGCDTELQ